MCNNFIKTWKQVKWVGWGFVDLLETWEYTLTCVILESTLFMPSHLWVKRLLADRAHSPISPLLSFPIGQSSYHSSESRCRILSGRTHVFLVDRKMGISACYFRGILKNLNNYFVPFVISMSWYQILELLREFKGNFLWIWLFVLSSVLWFIPK